MLAKITARNQLTLPTSITASVGQTDYYDIEVRNGTSPRNINDRPVDRDGDGYFDADEERAGSDPGNGQQTPGDRDGDGDRCTSSVISSPRTRPRALPA